MKPIFYISILHIQYFSQSICLESFPLSRSLLFVHLVSFNQHSECSHIVYNQTSQDVSGSVLSTTVLCGDPVTSYIPLLNLLSSALVQTLHKQPNHCRGGHNRSWRACIITQADTRTMYCNHTSVPYSYYRHTHNLQ